MILNHHGIMGLKQKVRIGDKLYKVVTIGNQVWLAENLALKTTNSVDREGYPEFGLYYPYSDIEEIENSVDGWHVPTEAELEELLISNTPDNTHKVQSTNYKSVWPSATNSTKFSAVPAAHSNDDTNLNRALLWYHAGYLGLQVNSLVFTNSTPALLFSVRLIKDTAPVTIGNKTYNTVKIGNQLWMMENLDYQFEGLNIGGETLQDDVHAWYFNNDPEQSEGLMYNGYAASYLAEHPELLPKGWRVPTTTDFSTLQTTVGGAVNAGLYLKKALPDTAWSTGVNSYRFYGKPSGIIRSTGVFDSRYNYLRLWTSTLGSETQQIFFNLQDNTNNSTITSFANNRATAIPIRLVKQVPTSSTTLSSLSTEPSEE